MSSSKLSERAWRMLEAGDDIQTVRARTRLSIAVLTGMMHDINRQKRAHTDQQPTTRERR